MDMAQHILRKAPRQPTYPVHPAATPRGDIPPDGAADTQRPGVSVPGVRSQPGAGALQRRKAFVKLANDRMVRAIDAITLLGNLANKKNYRYTENDVMAMESALRDAVSQTIRYFRSPREDKPTFALPEEVEGEEEAA